ncbi:TIGR01212 family radical SAM protein [Breznakia sp. PFB1-12]|uniref:TIGR01212 family radical SAM protein n=1 Tax=unclassified Breznakia TaxID=2623764 RepID=UPI00247E8A2D|nr:radical SAM protein (TIGR01212 family) [Breznakia sp. PH1-1]MDH6403557.1 radical SAM protein (TIGR01212 family) [Breznakia sp. PF1-11]MDH6411266.1 radical SAM protein (TIGR01212 family) [Breznakia sp. PFB1-11]MDH6413471.1 radical SAM protein (TIGR01212 family) [Breznakia sp. PFB1-14]MDH6415811.1 radical SAM protein (TIGR01212 family) [Breznakia sp. PFB1-4]MDH6418298.1 radical SAM protein (TIGR01212 family) [Breznakia sp. PFB1-12]MDH6475077.1 radical SAM protein (TIGR01212 family) [Breznaki
MNNPFPYSEDNKRYYTWSHYLKTKYKNKVFKVALNANFTCPNRDGTCGVGGCTFCSSYGSGDTIEDKFEPLDVQYVSNLKIMQHKWPQGKAIAYFQAYTNTYGSVKQVSEMLKPFLFKDEIVAISLATRADCLSDEMIEYLDFVSRKKDIWIELGLQTTNDAIAKSLNRGHDYQCFLETVERLSKTNLKICVHLMNSLPGESKEDMIQNAYKVGQLPIHAIKIHMLYILKDTVLGKSYLQHSFPMLDKDDYIDVVISQLEVLPKHIIIQRLTGDGMRGEQIGSEWMFKKTIVLNDIDKAMVARNTWQGKVLETK